MIVIDDREGQGKNAIKFQKYFKELEIDAKIERLPVGDIVENEKGICIEHKSISDFNGSIKDKRIFEQAENMKLNYTCNYIIIVGTFKKLFFEKQEFMHMNVHVLLGAMASLTAKYGIPVMTVDNDKQMIYLITKLMEKQGQPVEFVNRIQFTDKDVYTNMMSTIPGVGYKKAKAILDKMTFEEILMDDGTKLKEIKGIGDVLCQNVKKYVNIDNKHYKGSIDIGSEDSSAKELRENEKEDDKMKVIKISTGSGGEGSVRTVRIRSKADIKEMYSKGYPACSTEHHYPDCPTTEQIIESVKTTGELPRMCQTFHKSQWDTSEQTRRKSRRLAWRAIIARKNLISRI